MKAKQDRMFRDAASDQNPVVVNLGKIPWPAKLAPLAAPLTGYTPGKKITGAVNAIADVLVVLYTELETQGFLEVFTGDNTWNAERQKEWYGYAHNFAKIKPQIEGINDDDGLKSGIFGYLNAFKVGSTNVVVYKSELHPKQNGTDLPFVAVLQQLITELSPSLVISTGTAGGVGSTLNLGDAVVVNAARFQCKSKYPMYPAINTMSAAATLMTSDATVDPTYLEFAAKNLTKLSLPGLAKCYAELQKSAGFEWVHPNAAAPAIYFAGGNPVPGPQPMATVSLDYFSSDDTSNSEGLQSLGIVNETDDAFLFFAISRISGVQPKWLSIRNASDPQIHSTPAKLASVAGSIYGVYQYCTTLNSAFACWGVIAGLSKAASKRRG
jgi:hypothetical protein